MWRESLRGGLAFTLRGLAEVLGLGPRGFADIPPMGRFEPGGPQELEFNSFRLLADSISTSWLFVFA